MKKTKFNVTVHKNGNHSERLLKIIGNHNEGKKVVTLSDIIGYANCCAALYPENADGRQIITWEGKETLHLSENGNTNPYLTITECTYEELANVTEDDLTEVLN